MKCSICDIIFKKGKEAYYEKKIVCQRCYRRLTHKGIGRGGYKLIIKNYSWNLGILFMGRELYY